MGAVLAVLHHEALAPPEWWHEKTHRLEVSGWANRAELSVGVRLPRYSAYLGQSAVAHHRRRNPTTASDILRRA